MEDVQLNFCTDVEEFCPSAVPRLREAKTKTPAVSGSRHSLDKDPLSCAAHRDGDRTNGELQPTEIETLRSAAPRASSGTQALPGRSGKPSSVRSEQQYSAWRAGRRCASSGREVVEQCCRIGGNVPPVETDGPLGSLHLAQLERGSKQKVARAVSALQLSQRYALWGPDGQLCSVWPAPWGVCRSLPLKTRT